MCACTTLVVSTLLLYLYDDAQESVLYHGVYSTAEDKHSTASYLATLTGTWGVQHAARASESRIEDFERAGIENRVR